MGKGKGVSGSDGTGDRGGSESKETEICWLVLAGWVNSCFLSFFIQHVEAKHVNLSTGALHADANQFCSLAKIKRLRISKPSRRPKKRS